MTKRVYLALGSNVGDRERHLQQAVEQLAGVMRLLRASSTYETKPMYVTDQPNFLNLVLEAETDSFPRMLLRRTKAIEQDLGRGPGIRNGPRTIDIDILFFGRFVIETPDLAIPHPRLAERRFVLEPLAELAPELRHPVTKKTVKQMLAATAPEGIKKLAHRVALPELKRANSSDGSDYR